MNNNRARDLVLSIMFLSWAMMRIVSAEAPADRWTTAQLAPAVMHLVAALMFLLRSPPTREGTVRDVMAALPSFVAGGIMMNLAPAPSQWSWLAAGLFGLGAVGASVSLLTLGRSFAIFPAFRDVVVFGPFAIVRHPAYLFELLMLLAVAIAALDYRCWVLLPAAGWFFIHRILVEERLLGLHERYREYQQRVRYRLIPFLW